jgi:hypothetical protein
MLVLTFLVLFVRFVALTSRTFFVVVVSLSTDLAMYYTIDDSRPALYIIAIV